MNILATAYYGTLYTGVTSNLVGRIMQHRAGRFDGYTKKHSIHRLVYHEVADTMEVAIRREKQLKRYKREWKRNLIERQNPEWNDLAVGLGLDPLTVLPGPGLNLGPSRGLSLSDKGGRGIPLPSSPRTCCGVQS